MRLTALFGISSVLVKQSRRDLLSMTIKYKRFESGDKSKINKYSHDFSILLLNSYIYKFGEERVCKTFLNGGFYAHLASIYKVEYFVLYDLTMGSIF